MAFLGGKKKSDCEKWGHSWHTAFVTRKGKRIKIRYCTRRGCKENKR